MSEHDETDDIRERIEELDIMLQALQQATETLDLFLRPIRPPERSKTPC